MKAWNYKTKKAIKSKMHLFAYISMGLYLLGLGVLGFIIKIKIDGVTDERLTNGIIIMISSACAGFIFFMLMRDCVTKRKHYIKTIIKYRQHVYMYGAITSLSEGRFYNALLYYNMFHESPYKLFLNGLILGYGLNSKRAVTLETCGEKIINIMNDFDPQKVLTFNSKQ